MEEKETQLSMDHVQYEGTPPGSIFGPGEQPVNELLDRAPTLGSWINLGAGDGRYSERILCSCTQMTAFDIDARALAKLERDLDPALRPKLVLYQGDLTKPISFPDNSFDGALCAATIHIFAQGTIEKIIAEMFRIVRPGGRVILDFLFDIRREQSDGSLYLYPGEISYSSGDARRIIENCFAEKKIDLHEARVVDDFETDNGVVRYVFKGTIIVIDALK
jgi:SAM-dependent methyltransferase